MSMGEHVSLRSSNIASVAYDPEAQELEVAFTSGSRYRYAGVPPLLHDQLKASSSPGGFFAARIRPAYQARKVG